MANINVYVSSTAIDLKDHRSAVISALRKSGTCPVCMEDYAAQNTLPVDKCLTDVAACDLYIGLFAWRYGYCPEGYEGKSITELEYRKAKELGKTTLIFLLKEDYEWDSDLCDVRQDAAKIQALREEFKPGMMVGWFTTPDSLAAEVLAAVSITREDILSPLTRSANHPRPIPNALPALRGCFVDREVEQQTINLCMRTNDQQIVFIIAPGGFGKTELTAKLLHDLTKGVPNKIVDEKINGVLYLTCHHGDITLSRIFSEAGLMIGRQQLLQNVYADNNISVHAKIERFFSELDTAGAYWIVLDNFEDMLSSTDDTILDHELNVFFMLAASRVRASRLLVTSRVTPQFGERQQSSKNIVQIDLGKGLPIDHAVRYLKEEGKPYGLETESEEALRLFCERVHGIPKALESLIGYFDQQFPEKVSLSKLLDDANLFADFDRHDCENGLHKLIKNQLELLSPVSKSVLDALTIFYTAVPLSAIQVLVPELSFYELKSVVSRLCNNRLISYMYQSDTTFYILHPIVKTINYDRLASPCTLNKSLRSVTELHKLASEYYLASQVPSDNFFKTRDAIEPIIQTFKHLVSSGDAGAASLVLSRAEKPLQDFGDVKYVLELRTSIKDIISNSNDKIDNYVLIIKSCLKLDNYQLIYSYAETAFKACRENNDRKNEGEIISILAKVCSNQSNDQDALNKFMEALTIFQECGHRFGEAEQLSNIGDHYRKRSDTNQSVKFYQDALAIFHEIGNRSKVAEQFEKIGASYSISEANFQEALKYFKDAQDVYREIGERSGEATVLTSIGILYFLKRNYAEGLIFIHKALEISRETGNRSQEAALLLHCNSSYLFKSDFPGAISNAKKAYTIFREIGDRKLESITLGTISSLYMMISDTKEAIKYFEEAKAISKEIGSQIADASELFLIAAGCLGSNKVNEAIKYFDESIKIAQATGIRYLESMAFSMAGQSYSLINDYKTSIAYHQKALSIFTELGNRLFEARELNHIGNVHRILSEFDIAMGYFKKALTMFRSIGDRTEEANTLKEIAIIYLMSQESCDINTYLEESFAIYSEVGDSLQVASALSEIGSIYLAKSDYQTAIEYFKRSLSNFQKADYHLGEASVLKNIVESCLYKSEYEDAINYSLDRLSIIKKTGNINDEVSCLKDVADAYRYTNNFNNSIKHLKLALTVADNDTIINKHLIQADILRDIGSFYCDCGYLDSAIKYMKQSIFVLEESGNKLDQVTYAFYAYFIFLNEQYDDALHLLNNAFSINIFVDEGMLYQCLQLMARLHHCTGNIEQAKKLYNIVIDNDTFAYGLVSHVLIGIIHASENSKDLAFSSLSKAIELSSSDYEDDFIDGRKQFILGLALLSIGNTADSIATYSDACSTCNKIDILIEAKIHLDIYSTNASDNSLDCIYNIIDNTIKLNQSIYLLDVDK